MKTSRKSFPIVLSIPGITLTILLIFIPLVYNVYLSFHEKKIFGEEWVWVGFDNYLNILYEDEFGLSFINGIVYASSTVFLQILLGLSLALYLNSKIRYKSLFTGMLIFPYLIPTAVVIILWKWILSTDGILNFFLKTSNILNSEVNFLSENLAMPTLIFISVWQFFPFVMIMFLASLQSIDNNLYKSMEIDGGSNFNGFVHITLPHIKNLLIVIVLLRILWMFTKFDTVYIFIGESAIYKYAENIPVYAYRQAFQSFQLGIGAALTTILLVFLLIITSIFFSRTLFSKK